MQTRIFVFLAALLFQQCSYSQNKPALPAKKNQADSMEQSRKNPYYSLTDTEKLSLTDSEWKKILPADQYYIARQKGTERPWTSRFEKWSAAGTYSCAACGNQLFLSDTKFDSGCGWPSFFEPVRKTSLEYNPDHSHGMSRTEVTCGRCGAHLGHVFDDGPPPTGLRYCINGVILSFTSARQDEKKNSEQNKQ